MESVDLDKFIIREYKGIQLGVIYCVECKAIVIEIITWSGILKCQTCKRGWCTNHEENLRTCEGCDKYFCLECEPFDGVLDRGYFCKACTLDQ